MSQAMSSRESQGTPITSFHIILAGQKQHSVLSAAKLGKFNKNSFHQPLLLAPHHSQQHRMK